MKTTHSLVISLALGAGLLLPAVSQAHVDVNVSLGLPILQVAAAPVVVEPAPQEVMPVRVRYTEEPRFVPAAAPQPPQHFDPRPDERHWDDHGEHFRR